VLAAASLGFAVIQLDVSVVNVAIKPIGAALGSGVTRLQWAESDACYWAPRTASWYTGSPHRSAPLREKPAAR
jgi:hypothetical protein